MSGGHDDFAVEPVRGLPQALPEGERILWQGAPDWRLLALRAFHAGTAAAYFAVLAIWRGAEAYVAGADAAAVAAAATSVLPFAAAALAVLAGLAYVTARGTVYTITSKRVVLRFGVAITKAINLPYRAIAAAALHSTPSGAGDIALRPLPQQMRLGWSHLWPHVRPWRLKTPEPMLRALPDAASVARMLAAAMRDEVPEGAAHAVAEAKPVRQGPLAPAHGHAA